MYLVESVGSNPGIVDAAPRPDAAAGIRCLPLCGYDQVLGAIHLECPSDEVVDKEQLDLLDSAVSAISLGIAARRRGDERSAFFDSAIEPLCIVDCCGRIRRANCAWERVLGWTTDELLALDPELLIHPDDFEETRTAFETVADGDPLPRFLNRCQHKTGGFRWLEWSATQEEGRVFAQVRDVTGEVRRRSHQEAVERVTGVGSWELDLDTRQLYWSPTIYELYGLDPEAYEPRLEQVMAFYLPEVQPLLRSAIDNLTSKGTPYSLTLPFEGKDGQRCWKRLTGNAEIRDGKVIRVFGTSQDVTEERRRQQHVNRLGDVVQRTTNSVVIIDINRQITWCNPAFTKVTGFSLDEVLGKTPEETFLAPDMHPETIANVAAARDTEAGITCEMKWRDKAGRELWVEMNLQPWFENDGEHAGYIVINTDITERKAYAAKLEQARREAQTARERLAAALETLADGFVLFDKDDRLVLCNSRYREIYARSAAAMVPGASFREILCHGLKNGEFADAIGREEEWLKERLASHQRCDDVVEQHLGDGRWLRILERKTPEGGWVGLRIDITGTQAAGSGSARFERRTAGGVIGPRQGRATVQRYRGGQQRLVLGTGRKSSVHLHFGGICAQRWQTGRHPRPLARRHIHDAGGREGGRKAPEVEGGPPGAGALRQCRLQGPHHRRRRAMGPDQRRAFLRFRRILRRLSRGRQRRDAALRGDAARRGGKSGQVPVPGDHEP